MFSYFFSEAYSSENIFLIGCIRNLRNSTACDSFIGGLRHLPYSAFVIGQISIQDRCPCLLAENTRCVCDQFRDERLIRHDKSGNQIRVKIVPFPLVIGHDDNCFAHTFAHKIGVSVLTREFKINSALGPLAQESKVRRIHAHIRLNDMPFFTLVQGRC